MLFSLMSRLRSFDLDVIACFSRPDLIHLMACGVRRTTVKLDTKNMIPGLNRSKISMVRRLHSIIAVVTAMLAECAHLDAQIAVTVRYWRWS